MSIRSASANGRSRANLSSAPGASRQRPPLLRAASGSGSVTHLPSLAVTGSSFHRAAAPIGIPRPPLASAGSKRPTDVKENKNTAVITIDDLQRLRE